MPERKRVLDLFCGAGGASMGYYLAGFDVVGVDNKPQPNYPFAFHQADAMTYPLEGFDLIHASPPCQRWMGVPRALGDEYPDTLAPIIERLLQDTDIPFVVENVPTSPLPGFILCGKTFGLPIIRHRRFYTSWWITEVPSLCPQKSYKRSVFHGKEYSCFAHGAWRPRWREKVMPVLWPWMTIKETHDAIPPAYTEWIGKHYAS